MPGDTAKNLYLHYVSEGPPARRHTVSRDELRALVRGELDAGRRPASLADYVGGAPGPDRFTLSFDDGHRSVVEHALPVLRELGVTATVFVPTAHIGMSDEFLDWPDLARLAAAGCVIGSHSDTHPRLPWRLYDETDAAHEQRLTDDFARSRDRIARALGRPPDLLAYPYGEDPDVARRAARQAGFAAAFTVRGDSTWSGDPLSIPRLDAMELEHADQEPLGISVVVPAYLRMGILADVVTRLASLEYPEERYEVIVVDDGSPDDLSPLFNEMPSNLRLLRQGDRAFRAGQARQRGAGEARFDHVAFLDADVAVGPDFLWHLDWIHRRVPDAVVLGYLSGYNLHDLGHLHTPRAVTGADLATLPIIPDRSREPTLRACLDNLDWLDEPWPLTYTGNLSVPRALLARAGGFAGDMVGWGLEDVDLGYRLHRAGGRFVFSRFAVGYHVVDPDEGDSRNPFRAREPRREDFDGYLANLALLERRNPAPAVTAYAARARADIDETCGRPMTVGIELGGAASVWSRHHRHLHRLQPGGVPREELLDRVAYARKVGARTIYLLGGAPEEHPAFHEVVRAAKSAVSWVSMQSPVYPFGRDPSLLDLPLDGVVALIHTLDERAYEAIHGPGTYGDFARGLDRLAGRVELRAHLVIAPDTIDTLEATVRELARRQIRIEEQTILDPCLAARAAFISRLALEC